MINVNILDDFWNGENTIVNAVIQSNNKCQRFNLLSDTAKKMSVQ